MLRFIVALNPKNVFKTFCFIGVLFSLLVASLTIFGVFNDHAIDTELKNAKPYKLNIDQRTGYPIIDISKINVGSIDFQSPSFFVSIKNGVFLLTGGFWGNIRYPTIIEDLVNEPAIKGSRKFMAQVELFRGYFPAQCKESIINNLEVRGRAVSQWMIEKNASYYVFLDGEKPDIPSFESISKVCPTYFSRSSQPIEFAQSCVGSMGCAPISLDRIQYILNAKNESVFLEAIPAKKGDFSFSNSKNQAALLNQQFANYLNELNN